MSQRPFLSIVVPAYNEEAHWPVPRKRAQRRGAYGAGEHDGPPVIIGSREAPGAERTGESRGRRVSGRISNALVRMFAVPGIRDSQCGYKMLSAEAVATLASHLTIDGFAFDVELLYLARLAGFRIREVGITCHCRQDSRVRIRAGIASVLDVLRIRLKGRPLGRPFVRLASRSPHAVLSDPD